MMNETVDEIAEKIAGMIMGEKFADTVGAQLTEVMNDDIDAIRELTNQLYDVIGDGTRTTIVLGAVIEICLNCVANLADRDDAPDALTPDIMIKGVMQIMQQNIDHRVKSLPEQEDE